MGLVQVPPEVRRSWLLKKLLPELGEREVYQLGCKHPPHAGVSGGVWEPGECKSLEEADAWLGDPSKFVRDWQDKAYQQLSRAGCAD